MKIQRTFSGSPWEAAVGYCRALRVGECVYVSGTAPLGEDGKTYAPGDAYAQARRCFDIVETALGELGAALRHVVRTRMYVTDAAHADAVGRAHRERFENHPPVATLVVIQGLIRPDMLVEVEVDAAVPRAVDGE